MSIMLAASRNVDLKGHSSWIQIGCSSQENLILRSLKCGILLATFAFSSLVAFAPSAPADEPAKRFLNRLREEGYYDMGLKYLDLSAAKNRLPADMKTDLPLERVILMQESLRNVKTPQQREERMAAIEKGYREFLAAAPGHSRRSETQTKLGDLLLDRGQSALTESKKPENVVSSESWRSKSRQAYTEALDLYNKIAEELKPILESMAGDKIKTLKIEGKSVKELTELREQYQREYRQSQILQAKTMEFISQTYEEQAPDRKQWLEKSEASFNAVVEKTTGPQEAGRRMLSLLYLGEVQTQLGKIDEARNSYIRVSENEEGGIFRTWRIQAIAGIIRLDSTEKAAKYEAAIQRGEETLKTASTKERDDPEWLDLQLALAEARIAWGKKLDPKKEDNKIRNNRSAARELLQTVNKKKGPHQAKAQKSLSELGIETVEKKTDEKLPTTKAWADTIKVARERLDRAESSELDLPVLQQQATAGNNVQDQIQIIQDSATKERTQSIELYQRALRMYKSTDSRDDLIEAKFLLAYLYLRTEKYWECLALSQELLVSAKGTDKAQKAGGFAFMGLGKIISEASPERQLSFVPSLVRLANQLNTIDPASEEARNTVDLLVKLDLIHKRYDDALKHISLGQGKGSGGGASMLGQILWGEYQQAAYEHRKNKTEETSEEQKNKLQAETLLRSTWDGMSADKVDKTLVNGVNTLANIYLSSDRVDQALAIIDAEGKGAIALVNSVSDLEPSVKLEAYRLKLQALVQAAGSGKPLPADSVVQIVQTMKTLAGGDDTLLTNSLNNLAVKLQAKLEASKSTEEQVSLGAAFGVLISQLVTVSSDVAILDSSGSSILALATRMQKDPSLAGKAKPLMEIADAAFTKIAAKPPQELIDAKRKPDENQFKLAQAKSGAGKFEEAHAIYAKALATNPNNITFQVEAAKNLQLWSNGKDVELIKKSIFGAEPNAKKENAIWGWGKISTVTSGRLANFKEIFFEARLNIAKGFRLIALAESTPEKKKQGLEKASIKIRETFQTYPELGSPEIREMFEKTLREIQQDLGKTVNGLLEFNREPATK
jgi:tetratricopeptide (TPR) repeat protein